MKKITKIAAFAALVLGVAGMLQPANATCPNIRVFGSGYSYVVTPGCEGIDCGTFNYQGVDGPSSVTEDIRGAFWAIGDGNTAPGLGIDNGTYPFVGGACGSRCWGYIYPGYPAVFTSHWAASDLIDGCIDAAASNAPRCMAILLVDNHPTSGEGAFALLTGAQDGNINFSFEQENQAPINLTTLAKPLITNSVATASGKDVSVAGVSLSDIQGGLYLDETCPQSPIIHGYQMYLRSVPFGSPAPTDNDAANWGPVGPVVPLGQPSTLSVSCDSGDVYLTSGLVFDSAFRNNWVSGNSTRINCDATLADPEDVSPTKPRSRELPRDRSRGR